MSNGAKNEDTATRFGTFGGVFTPCVLTILGVIMFLRFGSVVGQAGILYAVLIVAISKTITGLTTLSLSAIATNTRIRGGGAYYLISRSLGVEFGGAIGLVFYHPKNWRPNILALTGVCWDRPTIPIYGHWFTFGQGILTLGQVIQGEIEGRLERLSAQQRILRDFIRTEELEAFPAVVVAPRLSDGIESLVQCHGMGALRSNTVLFGWPTDSSRAETFGATLRTIADLKRSIIVVRSNSDPADPWIPPAGTIDVWWDDDRNGNLMLLLAHLLTKNNEWRNRNIRLLRVIENEAGRVDVERHLAELCDKARITATQQALVSESPIGAIQEASRDAAVVIMGFEAPQEGGEQALFERMEQRAGELPRVVFVDSVGEMSLES